MSTFKLTGSYSGSTSITAPASGSDRVITFPDAAGTVALKAGRSHAILEHRESAGTSAGPFNSGAWQTRKINTEASDPDGIVSISTNQFTLAAGTYTVTANPLGVKVDRHVSRIYNATDSSVVKQGMSMFADDSYFGCNCSWVSARFTISGTKAFEIQHECQQTRAEYGMGIETSSALSNDSELYMTVWIEKE